MLSHFNLKSLIFYGTMIGSVLLLFEVVSSYGENYLKAPSPIGGTYRVTADNLPDCIKSDSLKLIIEQSGIFLFGTLVVTPTESESQVKIPLSGKFQNEQFLLSGVTSYLTSCSELTQNQNELTMIGKSDNNALFGDLNLFSSNIAFQAQQENPINSEENGH